MDFTSRLRHLNHAQKEAVETIDGPVMVIAGPGTGKTELLGMRTAMILRKTDTLPENILCLTFTESGASAMRERLTQIIGSDAYKVAIHTFHSFGIEVMNQNSEFFYHGADFRAADELSCYEMLRTILDELEYSNPLASKVNDEYTHLGDTLTTISELKRSGLTSDELLLILDGNDQVIDTAERDLSNIFADRLTKATTVQLASLIAPMRQSGGEIPLPGIVPLSRVLADSLEGAVAASQADNSTKPITHWRNTWCKKNDKGKFVLKARDRQQKLRALSYVYYQYLARMQENELYDFDDMILRVVHAMEVFPELRFNLQEKYHYIMVDEFQDTNMAQMRILYNLTNNEITDNRPNILAVGDDDQAIYSFQGADVSNINGFLDIYKETKFITLTDSYRSTATVLSHARDIITRSTERLEARMPELDKTLTAHHHTSDSHVQLVELSTISDECTWVIDAVAAAIKAGTPASSIAVLARRHHEIIKLLPYFAHAGIRVNYERRDNVLELEVIQLVEHVAMILVALFEKRHQETDHLLPQLLAHPALAMSPLEVWRLSLSAQKNRQTWMEVMAITSTFVPLHEWLITQSQALSYTPLERMLDEIIGNVGDTSSRRFVSPFFSYFFSPENLAEAPDMYLTYLEALRTIRAKLRGYRPNEHPTLQSFLEFIRMHRKLGSTITSIRPHSEHLNDAINLMTAHKSKGLEFDTVYIIGAVDNAWGEHVRTRSRLIGYPENLPLAPSGDTYDERLRLFFVAMTRARTQLTITYSTSDDNGKSTLPASFLVGENWQPTTPHSNTTMAELTRAAELTWYQPIIAPLHQDMRALLVPVIANYKLSSTHLNTFLDVSRGGPQTFLMNNLLRFPQAISPSAGYGSAIHATLQRAHAHLTATGKQRPAEDTLHDFEENLRTQNLNEKDFLVYLQKGSEVLSTFLGAKNDHFKPQQKTELNFSHQAVYLGEAHLTGSLDLVDIIEDSIIVTDYKTGKALRNWTGKTDYEKIKLHKYKQQLMFYQLLITHSRDYAKYTMQKGVLQFVEPTPGGEIVALEAEFAREDLERFSRLIQAVWRRIITLNLPDIAHYKPNYQGILAFENDLLTETTD